MSTASEPTQSQINAAIAFRDSIKDRADADFGGPPLWYGWAIMYAFLAGIEYARNKSNV